MIYKSKDLHNMNVYIAADFAHPPIKLAERIEKLGHKIPLKWWETSKDITGSLAYHHRIIKECDIFILDMRTPRLGEHPLAGSHMLLGIAYSLGKKCFLIPPESQIESGTRKGRRHYTSFSNFAIVENEDKLFNTIWK